MRNFIIIFLCVASCSYSSAQMSVVKDVEHALAVANPDYASALKNIKPALEHEETKDNPTAWFCAGKAGVGVWARMLTNVQIGAEVKVDEKKNGAHALIDAHTYLTKAMSLDSLPDGKGKVKPRYGKDIRKMLAKHYRSFRNAGIFLYDIKDLDGAYDAWEVYTTLPAQLNSRGRIIKADAPSDLGQIYYYQALCSMAAGKYANALHKFEQAKSVGFSNKEMYLYGMEAARREHNDTLMLDFARIGAKLYGGQEVSFNLLLINDRLRQEDYEGCRVLVDDALKVDSDDKVKSQLYDVLGIIEDHAGNFEGSLANFQKAVVYDESSAKAFFDLGRVIYNEALRIAESPEEGGEAKAAPGLEKAAEYFEKAYSLDSSIPQLPATLYNIYYRLGVGYESKAAYWEKRQ